MYSGIEEELQFGTCNPWQTIGKSEETKRMSAFIRFKEEIGLGQKEIFLPLSVNCGE